VALSVLAAATAWAGKQRVCLIEVADPSGQVSVSRTTKTVEVQLARSFQLVSSRAVAQAGRALRLPRSEWTTTDGLTKLAERLKCDAGLSARVISGLGVRRLTVVAYGPTGETLAEVGITMPRPRLGTDQAKDVVVQLETALARPVEPTAPPEPAEPTPPPAEEAPADDAWADAMAGFATPSTPAAALEAARLDTSVEVGGRVAAEHYAFFKNSDPSKLGGRDNIEAALRLKAAHPRATAFASILARTDFGDPSRNRFDPEEAWVEFTFPGVTLKAGRVIVGWGSASIYNPTDVLNAVDLRDPLDTEKLGSLLAEVSISLGPLIFEGYYLPVPEAHRFHPLEVASDGTLISPSRWITGSLDVGGTVPLTIHVAPFTPPPPRPSNSQAAARLELSVLGADLSVAYVTMLDHIPSPVVEAVPEPGLPLGADVYVDWYFRRLHVITADFERTFGKLRVAGEAAGFITADWSATNPRVADPYVLMNLAADYQTSPFAGDQRLHFFLELAHARALKGELAKDGLDLMRYPFQLSLLGRVEWAITQDLQLEVTAFSSLQRFDLYVTPRIEYSFVDRVKLRAGLDLLAGSADGFFGRLSGNSRFIVTMEARF
jgi:hypothetical protein